MSKKKILVLFSFKNHKTGYIEKLFDLLRGAAKERDLDLYRGSLKDLRIKIIDGKLTIIESMTGCSLGDFDLVYFELWYKARQQALAAARFCNRHSIPFFSHEMIDLDPDTKIGELAIMSDNDIPLPDSFTSSHKEIKQAFRKHPPINYPLIIKADDGYGGHDNFLVKNYKELNSVLDDSKKLTFVVQEFIPNDRDFRCIVFGGEIKFVLQRKRDENSDKHTNNTSSGAEGTATPISSLPKEAREAVIKAAKILKRDSFAGVDLMLDRYTGKPYILEVNQTPQIEIGAETEKKMDALLDYMESIAK